MKKYILAGCDLHDKTMLLMMAPGTGTPQKRSFANSESGCTALIHWLRAAAKQAPGAEIVLAYEASALGFGLYDDLSAAGITCHILAPSKIARSPRQRRSKTDEKDALHLLEILRGHYLAGNKLPSIWVPDAATRDDRELVRARLDAQRKCNKVQTQIRMLLKRNKLVRPKDTGKGWTKKFGVWLKTLSSCDEPMGSGARTALASLLRQMNALEQELKILDKQIALLSGTPRHKKKAEALQKLDGVGILSAMVFLVEMGDLTRFKNRRQLAAFLGIVPSSHESGEIDDRKGHITKQGPQRVRYVLCQAAWNRVRSDEQEGKAYERIAAKNPKHKKIALVAAMRRLAIRMWHEALKAA